MAPWQAEGGLYYRSYLANKGVVVVYVAAWQGEVGLYYPPYLANKGIDVVYVAPWQSEAMSQLLFLINILGITLQLTCSTPRAETTICIIYYG